MLSVSHGLPPAPTQPIRAAFVYWGLKPRDKVVRELVQHGTFCSAIKTKPFHCTFTTHNFICTYRKLNCTHVLVKAREWRLPIASTAETRAYSVLLMVPSSTKYAQACHVHRICQSISWIQCRHGQKVRSENHQTGPRERRGPR